MRQTSSYIFEAGHFARDGVKRFSGSWFLQCFRHRRIRLTLEIHRRHAYDESIIQTQRGRLRPISRRSFTHVLRIRDLSHQGTHR